MFFGGSSRCVIFPPNATFFWLTYEFDFTHLFKQKNPSSVIVMTGSKWQKVSEELIGTLKQVPVTGISEKVYLKPIFQPKKTVITVNKSIVLAIAEEIGNKLNNQFPQLGYHYEVHLFCGQMYPQRQLVARARLHRTFRNLPQAPNYELSYFAFQKLSQGLFQGRKVFVVSIDRSLENVVLLLKENGVNAKMVSKLGDISSPISNASL